MAKVGPKRKAANGYKLAERLPKGEILQDVSKKKWKLGPSIGQGGFGEIYSAQEAESTGAKYPYVIKVEPHTNGPLFVEMHFYMRNAKPSDIEEFKKHKKLKTFGMPSYLGSGSHEYKSEKYRFIVMEKFGTDLWKIFLENNRSFPTGTVFKLGVQILDVLEYIHQRGYVHADIKGSNILMGQTKETVNKQVYLVDFGLATKFTIEKEFKSNPKKAHDGTIEYLSRDAHKGVQTRRGDLEILAYNLIQWLGCALPWERNLKDPNAVHKDKEDFMHSVPKMIKACFGNRSPPGTIVDYLNYVNSLKFNGEPDYKKIRSMFVSEIKKARDAIDKPLVFSTSKETPLKRKGNEKTGLSPRRKTKKVEDSEDEKENVDNDDDVELEKSHENSRDEDLENDDYIIEDSFEDEPKKINKRAKKPAKNKNIDEALLTPTKRRVRKKKTACSDGSDEENHKEPANDDSKDPFEGYTDAMKEVMKKIQNGKVKSRRRPKQPTESPEESMDGYTESMKEVMLKKKERLAGKRQRGKKTDAASVSKASDDVVAVGLRRTGRRHQPHSYTENGSDSE